LSTAHAFARFLICERSSWHVHDEARSQVGDPVPPSRSCDALAAVRRPVDVDPEILLSIFTSDVLASGSTATVTVECGCARRLR